jgi:hypothetical protein
MEERVGGQHRHYRHALVPLKNLFFDKIILTVLRLVCSYVRIHQNKVLMRDYCSVVVEIKRVTPESLIAHPPQNEEQ